MSTLTKICERVERIEELERAADEAARKAMSLKAMAEALRAELRRWEEDYDEQQGQE